MKKQADATILGERIFLNAKKGTESVAALSEPLFELSIKDSPELLGAKVRECIEAYQPGRDRYTREDWKKINDPLIKFLLRLVLSPYRKFISIIVRECYCYADRFW